MVAAHGILLSAGYRYVNRIFVHEEHPFTIDFPAGPLAIGASHEPIETVVLEEGGQRLKILSVTDCVKDRLAGYYSWGDYETRMQALQVAIAQRECLDMERLSAWSRAEESVNSAQQAIKKWRKFCELLEQARSH